MNKKIIDWWTGGASYSSDAQAVFALMSGLTPTQKNAMATFIDGCVSDGNWTLLDVFQFYTLGATNGLKNWISSSYNATNPDGYSFVASGIDITATGQGIVTNYNPTTGAKWTQRNAVEGVYVYANDSTTDQRILICGSSNTIYLYQRTVASRIDYLSLNGLAKQVAGYANGFVKGLWSGQLIESGANDFLRVYLDGTSQGDGTTSGTAERNETVHIGGRPTTPTTFDGRISLYYAGAGDGFNVAAFSTRVNTLLTAFGV